MQGFAETKALISGYGAGAFTINSEEVSGSQIIIGDNVYDCSVTSIDALTASHIQPLLDAAAQIEILLIGSGEGFALLPPGIKKALSDAGIVCDVMDTGAACRTYNILMSEDRNVAALLVAV